jgi:uncharacterized protein (TIGR02594 family)
MSFLDLFKRIKPRNMSPEQRIYDAAKKYLGVSEVSGKQSNPKIVAWIDQAAEWLKDGVDDIDGKIAWCGCFRGAIGFETATGVVAAPYRASSWLKWGKSIIKKDPSTWPRGATVVMSRPGGNHVALIDRVVGDYAYLLGGNQANSVSVSRFQISKFTDVRVSL